MLLIQIDLLNALDNAGFKWYKYVVHDRSPLPIALDDDYCSPRSTGETPVRRKSLAFEFTTF